MTSTAESRLIGVAIATLRELRATTLAALSAGPSGEADAVDALREAGFAGGDAVFDAFEQWLGEIEGVGATGRLRPAPDLTLEEFADRAAAYFRAAGWGIVQFDSRHDNGVVTLTVNDCWEVDNAADESSPSCHVTTGMLAAFFGKLAGYPVAVMETECRSAGAERCRFLLGNSHVMAIKWEELR